MNTALAELVCERARDCCEYCRMPQRYDELPFQFDHVVAEQHGGRTIAGNLALACFADNHHKGPNLAGIDPKTGQGSRRGHPHAVPRPLLIEETPMSRQASLKSRLKAAADAIQSSDALLIGAGAGMGVDSGLPDFRGPEGFWKAYPPFRGREFAELSTPHWFRTDPSLAWGFFGHRLNLYRAAIPHRGFEFLGRWGRERPLGSFVFTSNVDGQFQKAGFAEAEVVERHGSIHYLQCTRRCGRGIWPADDVRIDVDEATIRSRSEFPVCPDCGAIARPNILMFGDWEWDPARHAEQQARYASWLDRAQGRRVVAIELGAGLAIPTVRDECESRGAVLIRINPREAVTHAGGIPLPLGALEALGAMDALM